MRAGAQSVKRIWVAWRSVRRWCAPQAWVVLSCAMLSPLRSRTYRHLFAAQVIALLGTGLATVALGLVAYQLAGADAGAVLGTALAIKMVAYV